MVGPTLVTAMTNSYKLSIAAMPHVCSGLAVIFNGMFLPAAIMHVRRITIYCILALIAFDIAASPRPFSRAL